MQFLVRLYDKTLIWSQHPAAPKYLAAVSFVEASVFPIPPYFMLAPMALARPDLALRFALIATVFSVLGGILGYALGYVLFNPVILPLLNFFGYIDAYNLVTAKFTAHSFWAVLVLGFMPIPYKIVAIAAGVMNVALLPFIAASIIGRGVKFYTVSLIVKFGGVKMEQYIRSIIAKAGLLVAVCISGVLGLKVCGVF